MAVGYNGWISPQPSTFSQSGGEGYGVKLHMFWTALGKEGWGGGEGRRGGGVCVV